MDASSTTRDVLDAKMKRMADPDRIVIIRDIERIKVNHASSVGLYLSTTAS